MDGAELVVGKSDELPFEDNTFDVVTCSQSFHHYPDTDKAMKIVKGEKVTTFIYTVIARKK